MNGLTRNISMNNFIPGVEEKYPRELLSNRNSTEGNVISCLLKDILILDENKFNKDMFLTEDARLLFEIVTNLRDKGIYESDEVSIKTNLGEYGIAKLEEIGGFQTIQHLKDIINTSNFESYYNTLVKENIFIKMWDDNVNLLGQIKIGEKHQNMLKFLRTLPPDGVEEFWETRISDYGVVSSGKVLEEEDIEFSDDFINSCEEGEENGIPIDSCGNDINGRSIPGFRWLNDQMLGLRRGYISMLGGFSSSGKSTFIITMIMALISRGERVLIISNEEDSVKFKSKFLVWALYNYCKYTKLTKAKLLSGEITEEDKKQIAIVNKYWNEQIKPNLKFISIEDADIDLAKKKIREYKLKYSFTAFCYDTLKISESDMGNQRTDLALVRDSRELHKTARKYNMIGIVSVQLAESMKGTLCLTAQQLSNAKQLKEVVENLILMRSSFEEEFDPENKKYFCKPYKYAKDENDRWIRQDYPLDENSIYKIVFLEKTRNGKNSEDTNSMYIYKFIGDYSSFREECHGHVRHGYIGV